MSKIDLRDYFAAKAMQALITAHRDNLKDSVRIAYTYADAMLRYGLDHHFDWDEYQQSPEMKRFREAAKERE